MGIFSTRMNKHGAIAGMLSGISFTALYIVYFQFLGGTPSEYLLGISPEGIGFVGMLINFAVATIVSIFTPAPPEDIQEMVENIHIPSGSGDASH